MTSEQQILKPSHDPSTTRVAYFSMEIALDAEIPGYSGGLGVLAGDMLRSAADLEVPMIGVTLVHHNGYFRQKLDSKGNQVEEPERWSPALHTESLEARAHICGGGGPYCQAACLAVLGSRDFGPSSPGVFTRFSPARKQSLGSDIDQ